MKRVLLAALLVVAAAPAGATGNEPPLADAGLDQRVDRGATVLLDATGSRDPDGDLTRYEWRIESPNGTATTPDCPTCGRTRFVARQSGRYEVTVRVTDDDGATRTDTLYVYVEGTPTDGAPGDESTPSDGAPSFGTSSPDSPSTDSRGTPPSLPPDRAAGNDSPSSEQQCADADFQVGDACGNEQQYVSVELDGPARVAVGESAPLTTVTTGFADGKSYGWSISATGAETSKTWNAPGVYTVFVTVRDASGRTGTAQHTVRVVDNRPPTVGIADPGNVVPGERITLTTSVKRDPDGRIVETQWSRQLVTVPSDGSEVDVAVTVTDNDGATATDSITITGEREEISNPSSTTVYCYYTDESQKTHGNPHHCENPSATDGNSPDGYSSGGGTYDYYSRHPEYFTIVWKKVPASHLNGDSSGASGEPSDLNEGAYPTTGIEGGSSGDGSAGAGDGSGGSATAADTMGSFTLNGKTVYADLTGDGEVNAADWDQRYGSHEQTAEENHETAVERWWDTHRAIQNARNAEPTNNDGATADPSDDGGSNTHQSNSDSTGGSADGGTDHSHHDSGDDVNWDSVTTAREGGTGHAAHRY